MTDDDPKHAADKWVIQAFATTYSSKASEIARNLAFVGLGLILLLGGVAKDSFGS